MSAVSFIRAMTSSATATGASTSTPSPVSPPRPDFLCALFFMRCHRMNARDPSEPTSAPDMYKSHGRDAYPRPPAESDKEGWLRVAAHDPDYVPEREVRRVRRTRLRRAAR